MAPTSRRKQGRPGRCLKRPATSRTPPSWALCYAVSQGAPVAELQKLLDQGRPADPPEDKVVPPLSEAAVLGDLPAVQLLVERGANVNGGRPLRREGPAIPREPSAPGRV